MIVFLTYTVNAQWVQTNGPYGVSVSYLAVSGSTIFIGTPWGGEGILRSTNNGASWNAVDSGLSPAYNIRSFAVSGDNIFAGGGSVHLSTDNGMSWTEVDSGLTTKLVTSLAVSDSTIFAGTNGSSVWQRPLSEMVEVVNPQPQQEMFNQVHFKISPLSGSGSIVAVEFSIPHPDRVTVTMYDPAGKEISSLINQQLNTGSYRYLWDTHTFARGCYMARMKVGATTCIKLVRIVH